MHCQLHQAAPVLIRSVSRYDQTLYEDSDVNRMNEAAGLFESISNSRCVVVLPIPSRLPLADCRFVRWFAQSSVILFMNKTDLFRAKLVSSPIYEYYSDYEGPSDYPTGCAYMQSKFTPLYRNGSIHPLHCLFTCATGEWLPQAVSRLSTADLCTPSTDTEQLRTVFNAVEENIMTASLIDAVGVSQRLSGGNLLTCNCSRV